MSNMRFFHPIRVMGVGGGGSNAIDRMIQVGVPGADFVALNTDLQALQRSESDNRIQLGTRVTRGLGAGANPEVGARAGNESQSDIEEACDGAELLFVTAGLGGGTGSGAAPIVARVARNNGAVVVAVVTMPFGFEGSKRRTNAMAALETLRGEADTIVVVHNDRLLDFLEPQNGSIDIAFRVADECLRQAVEGISSLIHNPGTINLDFADIKAVLGSGGLGHFSIGMAEGDEAACKAMRRALSSPLLGRDGIDGAKAVIANFRGQMALHDMANAMEMVNDVVDEGCNIMWGTSIDETMDERVEVTLMAVGLSDEPVAVKRESSARRAAKSPKVRVLPARDEAEVEVETQVEEIEAPTRRRRRSAAIALEPEVEAEVERPRRKAARKRRPVAVGGESAIERFVREMGIEELDDRDPFPIDDLNIPAFLRRRGQVSA